MKLNDLIIFEIKKQLREQHEPDDNVEDWIDIDESLDLAEKDLRLIIGKYEKYSGRTDYRAPTSRTRSYSPIEGGIKVERDFLSSKGVVPIVVKIGTAFGNDEVRRELEDEIKSVFDILKLQWGGRIIERSGDVYKIIGWKY